MSGAVGVAGITENFEALNIGLSPDVSQAQPQTLEQKIEHCKELVQAHDPQQNLLGVSNVRKLLSIVDNPPIDQVLQANILPSLMNFFNQPITPENQNLQFETSWALTNIASGTSDHVSRLVSAGVLEPALKQLRESKHDDNKTQAAWLLANIAGDSVPFRNMIMSPQYQVPETIWHIVSQAPSVAMTRNMAFFASNCMRGKPYLNQFNEEVKLLRSIRYIFETMNDAEALVDAAWALSYFSACSDNTDEQRMDAIQEAKLVMGFKDRLAPNSSNPKLIAPILRVIGNFCSGADRHTQHILDQHLLPPVCTLLRAESKHKQELLFILSNIAAGTQAQVQYLIDADIMPTVIDQLLNGATMSIKVEAAWTISNLLDGGTPQQLAHLMALGLIQAICVVTQNLGEGLNDVPKLRSVLGQLFVKCQSRDPTQLNSTIDDLHIRSLVEQLGFGVSHPMAPGAAGVI